MTNAVPLVGFCVASWPGNHSPDQLIGLRILDDKYKHIGFWPGDFAVALKSDFATIKDGDLVAVLHGDGYTSEVAIERYSEAISANVLGRIIRSWRNY